MKVSNPSLPTFFSSEMLLLLGSGFCSSYNMVQNHRQESLSQPKLAKMFMLQLIVSLLRREEGYTVKFTPSPEKVPEGEA